MARKPSPTQAVQPTAPKPQQNPMPGVAHQLHGMAIQQQYSGPIPSPDMMAQYAPEVRVVILRRAEEEQSQRNARLHKALEADAEDRRMLRALEARGQWFGFGIGIAGVLAAAVMAIKDQPVAASIIAALDLVALVSVFVTGRFATRDQGKKGN